MTSTHCRRTPNQIMSRPRATQTSLYNLGYHSTVRLRERQHRETTCNADPYYRAPPDRASSLLSSRTFHSRLPLLSLSGRATTPDQSGLLSSLSLSLGCLDQGPTPVPRGWLRPRETLKAGEHMTRDKKALKIGNMPYLDYSCFLVSHARDKANGLVSRLPSPGKSIVRLPAEAIRTRIMLNDGCGTCLHLLAD